MIDAYIRDYDVSMSKYLAEYYDIMITESAYLEDGYDMLDSELYYMNEDAKEVIAKITETIKSLFDKIILFIRDKIKGGDIDKKVDTVDEMIRNSSKLKSKKITIPWINMNPKNVADSIKKDDPKPFFDSSKTMETTIGQAFAYVKNNIKSYAASMNSTLKNIVSAVSKLNPANMSTVSAIAKNFAECKKYTVINLLKTLYDAVLYYPKQLLKFVKRKLHIGSDQKDAIKILRRGKKIRQIKINGIDVHIIELQNSQQCQQVLGTSGGFVACSAVGLGWDTIFFEPAFFDYPDYQQNAIIYHELAHATQQERFQYNSKLYGKSKHKREDYYADLKKAYRASCEKHPGYQYNNHLSIHEVEADFVSAKNGSYKATRDLLQGILDEAKQYHYKMGIIDAEVRLEVLRDMHKWGYC